MSYDTEHYYAVQTFLEDEELSMRLYDQELESNIECDS